MPIYEFQCGGCTQQFEVLLSLSEMDTPLREPCPHCGESQVKRIVSVTTMGVDMNVTPDKKTGGDFSRLIEKLKYGTPERYHAGLDKSAGRRGGKLGPQ